MLSHLSLAAQDLQNFGRFYDAALGVLGYVRVWTADAAIGCGVKGGDDKLVLSRVQKLPVCPLDPVFT